MLCVVMGLSTLHAHHRATVMYPIIVSPLHRSPAVPHASVLECAVFTFSVILTKSFACDRDYFIYLTVVNLILCRRVRAAPDVDLYYCMPSAGR